MRTRLVGVIAACALASLGAASSHGHERAATARYGDRTITMDGDWDGARACAVYDDGAAECWDTFEQMERATGGAGHPRDSRGTTIHDGRRGQTAQDGSVWAAGDAPSGTFFLAADCDNDPSRWLYLWEHNDFNGRALKFNDVDYWQNLTAYGFNDQLSSFWNATRCNAYLAEHTNGGGSWLWAPAQTAYSAMPAGWNDRVSSLYIIRR